MQNGDDESDSNSNHDKENDSEDDNEDVRSVSVVNSDEELLRDAADTGNRAVYKPSTRSRGRTVDNADNDNDSNLSCDKEDKEEESEDNDAEEEDVILHTGSRSERDTSAVISSKKRPTSPYGDTTGFDEEDGAEDARRGSSIIRTELPSIKKIRRSVIVTSDASDEE